MSHEHQQAEKHQLKLIGEGRDEPSDEPSSVVCMIVGGGDRQRGQQGRGCEPGQGGDWIEPRSRQKRQSETDEEQQSGAEPPDDDRAVRQGA